MADIITPNLGLTIPAVLSEAGPTYAENINNDLSIIDSLVYSLNNPAPTAGLNINADLTFNQNNLTEVRSLRLHNNGFNLTGSTDLNCVYDFSGNLWFRNSSGTQVQITNGSVLVAGTTVFNEFAISANYTVNPSDNYNYYKVSTASGALSITLPAASAFPAGRAFYIKDIGNTSATNNITLIRNGTDTFDSVASNRILNTNLGSWLIVSNGVSNWDVWYSTTKIMLDGRFGTDTQTVLVQGSATTIGSVSTGALTLGNVSNVISIGGTALTISASIRTKINSTNIEIGTLVDGATTIGKSATSTLDIVATPTFHALVNILNGLTVTNTLTTDSLVLTGSGLLGTTSADTLGISATATFGSLVTFNGLAVHNATEGFHGTSNFFGATNYTGVNTFTSDATFNGQVIANVNVQTVGISSTTGTGQIALNNIIVPQPHSVSGTGSGGRLLKSCFDLPDSNANINIQDFNIATINVATTSRTYTVNGSGTGGDLIRFLNFTTHTCTIVNPTGGSYTISAASTGKPGIIEIVFSVPGWQLSDWN